MAIQMSWFIDPLREEGEKLSGASSTGLRHALVPQIGPEHLLR